MDVQSQKITVSVPVKSYVKRFLEINYGSPVDFSDDPVCHKFFQQLLRKPNYSRDKQYPETLVNYSETVDVLISEHDFYRYGWELSKTNTIAFGRFFEDKCKMMMRTIVGITHGLGIPINKSIERFQDRFRFDEDVWRYEAIKKDFYRNGQVLLVDFDKEIFSKIEKIILRNLYDLGTLSKQLIDQHETA